MGKKRRNRKASSSGTSNSRTPSTSRNWEPVETFRFHESFTEDTNNGLYFNDIFLPEEIVRIILSYVETKHILKATLVCKKWCNIIKSDTFWATMYSNVYKLKPKKLPWYVYYCFFTTDYFDKNLLKNGNGEKGYEFWRILLNNGNGFEVENPPAGADPLPLDVPDFNGQTSCFATSYEDCSKLQEISLKNNRLIQYILNKFTPHIYLSEWVAGRFDCGCIYTLWCRLLGEPLTEDPTPKNSENQFRFRRGYHFYDAYDEFDVNKELYVAKTGTSVEQWAGSTWSKVELVVKDYPPNVKSIIFHHQGKDTQWWAGHYGSKMAGGVVKILFDSMEIDT